MTAADLSELFDLGCRAFAAAIDLGDWDRADKLAAAMFDLAFALSGTGPVTA